MNDRKGDALTIYIIGVVVLVASVVAIFYLISQVDFREDIDKQACKQSIVLRSSLNFDALNAADAVDLECKTRKICLSLSGEECNDVSGTKENPVENIKITPCKIDIRSGVNLDPPEAVKIDREGLDLNKGGQIINSGVGIGDRYFEPIGDGEGYVRIDGNGIFHVRNVRIVTKERIEIVVPNEDTYVLFNDIDHGYSRYIEIIGQRDNHNIKNVRVSGEEYELENSPNAPLKFVLDESGSLVTKSDSGEYEDICSVTRREIMDVFADQMVRCQDMVGEGKLNFIGENDLEQLNYGLVCNRIVFDEELKKLPMKPITFLEFYSHLNKRKVGDRTDFEYLYPGIDGVPGLVRVYEYILENNENVVVPPNPSYWRLNLNQPNGYGIVVNIAPKGQLGAVGTAAIPLIAVPLVFSGIGAPIALTILGTAGSTAFTYWYNIDGDFDYSPPTIVPFTFDTLRKLNIYDFEVAP